MATKTAPAKKEKKVRKKEKHIPQVDAYVLNTLNWEYNDEIYHRGENGDAGLPSKVYLNPDKAEEACFKANKEKLLEEDLSGFTYDNNELVGQLESVGAKFTNKNGESVMISAKNSDETLKEVMQVTGMEWFKVIAVKLDIEKTLEDE